MNPETNTSRKPSGAPFESAQAEAMISAPWITLATPTYNRRRELQRLYDSLLALRAATAPEISFEWLIIDDGSTDGTSAQVALWTADDRLPIRYFYQENRGKHVADNRAVELARGEMILSIDSDDELTPDALNLFHDTWYSLTDDERAGLKGVTARCIDPATGRLVGTPLPRRHNGGHFLIASPQDLRHRYHVRGEMVGFTRRDILLQYPHEIKPDVGKFMPEGIIWYSIGKKYKEYVIDKPARLYHQDEGGAIMSGGSRNRAPQNYYLWQYQVNNLLSRYLFRDPKNMLKAAVGMSMDGFRTGRSLATILRDSHGFLPRLAVLSLMPAGWLLSKR
ncbi:MAG: glycosyltransferase [Muribaculaceae bacterium]|nr:glycosyltransferase [Muribaculaceae bacterium]